MSQPTCVCCGQPLADGAYACTRETAKAAEQLRQISDMVPAARDIAHGLSRRGGEGASGKPGSRLPLDLMATAKLDAVQHELTKWIDHIGPIRGHMRPWFVFQGDPIVVAAHWLPAQLEWIRHQPDHEPDGHGNTWGAEQFLTDIAAAARVVAGIARGPAPQKYLGPCGALIVEDYERSEVNGVLHESATTRQCDGDVYVRGEASVGRCRTCGAEVARGEREIWLDEQVSSSDLAWTARGIADALGIHAKTLRAWATERRAPNGVILRRAKLSTYWHDGERLVPWVDPSPSEDVKARGPRLHYVGDVMALAKEAADRRAEVEARRTPEEVRVAS